MISALRTPTLHLRLAGQIFAIKDETRQTSGAFKYRGVIRRLRSVEAGAKIYAASTGNHGLAVALASASMRMNANIFLPVNTEIHKARLIRAAGAQVVLAGETLIDSASEAERAAAQQGGVWISGFDDETVVAGYRSVFTELLEDAPDLKAIAVPVGGGGLLAAALLEAPRDVEVFAVQTDASQSLAVSLTQKIRTAYPVGNTIAGGLRVTRVGELAFRTAIERPPRLVSVSDVQIRHAMKVLWTELGIQAEASGAVAFAGMLASDEKSQVGCIVSGGNIAVDQHRSLVAV